MVVRRGIAAGDQRPLRHCGMANRPASPGFPWTTTILLIVVAFLYAVFLANLLGAHGSDAAGRGMAMGFAALTGIALWLVLAGLFAESILHGRMPGYAAASVVVLLPLSAVAAATAAGLHGDDRGDWLIAAPVLLPPLLAFYALWARLSGWHTIFPATVTTIIVGSVIVLLTAAPLALATIELMPDPARDAAEAARMKAYEEEAVRRGQEAAAQEAARFARLGPDSPLRDYLEYLPPGHSLYREAIAGARVVTQRNAEAAALLREGAIGQLADLRRLDVDPAIVCDAYGTALRAEAGKIVQTRSDYLTVALDLERQLPNIEWLVGSGCDLRESLSEVTTRIRAVSDSSRLDTFADTLAALRPR